MSKFKPKIVETLGNRELLELPKTAFFCSRSVPASVILKCYDWAISQRQSGNCVISGFHSRIERDVLHYLLSGNQPIIIALARGMPNRIQPEVKEAIDVGRLLMITPFEKNLKRATVESAEIRNRLMVQLSGKITIGYATKNGLIEKLTGEVQGKTINRIFGNH